MRDSRTLNLLLVEDEFEDDEFLCDALLEIEESGQWCNWRCSRIEHADRLADAVRWIQRCSFDAILLNLSLPDSPTLIDSFLKISACAAGVPILVLADEADENLAHRLLREGAQDVLVKPELECAPLARAIRYAIERQRKAKRAQASAFVDDLTGVLTREAFLAVAAHCGDKDLLALVEIAADRDGLDPLLMQVADVLRASFETPSVIGRSHQCRFCVITAGLTKTAVEEMLHRAGAKVVPTGFRFHVTALDPRQNLEDAILAD